MKIGIITQPLHTNYGGLLQNYALQQILIAMNHDVYTINKSQGPFDCRWNVALYWRLKQLIMKCLGKQYSPLHVIRKHCLSFIKENIRTTYAFRNDEELEQIIDRHNFDAYVVGSDQVWRPSYSSNIYNDFLDFCHGEKQIKRIAYAVSFGVDEWEYTEGQTEKCSHLIKLFRGVSVREDSGIRLCKEKLNVNAIQVLDPTLLLEKDEYIKLVEKDKEDVSCGNLFCYILDNNEAIQNAIYVIEKQLTLKSFQVKAKFEKRNLTISDKIKDYIIPSPTKWLRAFMDAKMVFTDSFHGCVFSIIFNKPFWVIGNPGRGNARFDSLLRLFDLENRRVDINNINTVDFRVPIDWNKVNTIKKEWQIKSIKFLKDNL